jgi:aminoglycoside phosphotransferase family enzyme
LLYLDIVPVTRAEDKPVLAGPGPVIEYALKMVQWTIFDCIEFSEAVRFIDVQSDLAFLLMHLSWQLDRDEPLSEAEQHYAHRGGDHEQ